MCKQCQTNPVYEFTNKRKLCKNCFIHWFEKKALYTIRKFNMLNKGDVVSYEKKSDFRSVVLGEILKLIAEKGRINLTSGKKFTKIAIQNTIDLIAYEIINELINGKNKNLKKLLPAENKFIKPLYLFLDKEILLYAKLKKLKFEKCSEKKDKISEFINELEKKHPEVKRAVVNGFLKLDWQKFIYS
jgi:hypothetical protein